MDYLNKINLGFKKNIKNGIIYYTVPSFEKYVDFIFCGDVSNWLSFKAIRETTTDKMQESFRKLCDTLSLQYSSCVMTNIVHGDVIAEIDEIHKGFGVSSEIKLPPCDALVTKEKNIPIATTHADCMPIAIYDKKQNIGCVIHAGWRGVLAGIHIKSVELFIKKYYSSPKDLLVAIGPTIQHCCFEVDKDVTDLFTNKYFYDDYIIHRGAKDKLDLQLLVVRGITEFDIPFKNITADNRCTACKTSGLDSYRRDKDKAGTMVQIMCLK